MSVIGSNILAGSSGQVGYNLTRSLRFRSSASAYLSRTPASSGSLQKFTWSGWVKRGTFSTSQYLMSAQSSGVGDDGFRFNSTDTFVLIFNDNTTVYSLVTTQVFRDPSSWYHITVAVDTTQATASNREIIYINGVQVTSFSTANYVPQNYSFTVFNKASFVQNIARYAAGASYFDGYMAEVNFIDGQQLTPSSFGQTSSTTGVWQPKKYTGTYGTNGFYLPFTDNSALTSGSNAGLGKDFSGNGNYWNTNNISITSGSTYDSMTDVPTLTSATASNFATWNPVGVYVGTPTDGNLKISATSAGANGTIGASSGKFYWETVYTAIGSNEGVIVGIRSTDSIATNAAENVGYYGGGSENGKKIINGTTPTAYGATWTTGDVIGVAVDLDGGTVTFYKNNVSQGPISFTVGGKTWTSFNWRTGPASGVNTATINYGQQPFVYTPPTGYVALNTYNLPTPTIGATASSQANKYFDILQHTGGASASQDVTGLQFQPDFIWIKSRAGVRHHALFDAVRGANQGLVSSLTYAESTWSGQAFLSNGYRVDRTFSGETNTNGETYVDWAWKANGTGVTNTAGSITSTVSANTTSGFSVVTFTGNGSSGATVGHGLGVAPKMIIVKQRNGTNSWTVYQAYVDASPFSYILNLNSTSAKISTSQGFQAASSSTFTIGTDGNVNGNGSTFVAYCFAEVAGFSKFGSYTGNGSADGTFVYTGFRPKYVMVKRTDTTANWLVMDGARNPYNSENLLLYPNLSDAEYTGTAGSDYIDALSNGFKVRSTTSGLNASGGTYIYMAFAEFPFRYSLAR